jgi:hypothetical protein
LLDFFDARAFLAGAFYAAFFYAASCATRISSPVTFCSVTLSIWCLTSSV